MTAATAAAMDKAMVGQPAPDFEMASTKNIEKLNEPVRLSDYRGKWLVMVFYPLDFTFVCPTELTTFSDRYQDFVDIGADVIGISTDSVYSHRAWINTPRDKGGVADLKYPLAADATKKVANDYGVLIESRGIALRGGETALQRGLGDARRADVRAAQGRDPGGLPGADARAGTRHHRDLLYCDGEGAENRRRTWPGPGVGRWRSTGGGP